MQTKDCSPEEIKPYVAYFDDLKASSLDFLEREGIAQGAYEMLAAKKILPIAASARGKEGANAPAPIDIPRGVSVFICETPPGNGPAIHAHMRTRETFMCLKGRYEIRYGHHGKNSLELGPMDTVSVPDEVMRSFKNVSDETGYLLVLIHETEGETALNDVFFYEDQAERIEAAYGANTLEGLKRVGNQFTANDP